LTVASGYQALKRRLYSEPLLSTFMAPLAALVVGAPLAELPDVLISSNGAAPRLAWACLLSDS